MAKAGEMPNFTIAVAAADQPTIGVHSIDRYELTVPDIDEGKRFYETFGLRCEQQGDFLALSAADDHVFGRLYLGDRRKLRRIVFNAFAPDLKALAKRTQAHSDTRDFAHEGDAFEFRDFDGNLFRVQAGPRTMPMTRTVPIEKDRGEGRRGSTYRRHATKVQPQRLAHILIFSTDVDRSVRYFAETIGLGLSDQSAGIVAFLHAIHGCDHHLLAFAKSEAPGFHHSSWDVASVEDVGLGAMRMSDAGWKAGWGFGRHVLGSNYFHYVQDPWGSFAEYSFDIDYIPEGSGWDAGDHPAEDGLYLWGPDVPDIFLTNYEVDPPVGPAVAEPNE